MSRRNTARRGREVLAAITAEELVLGLVAHEGERSEVVRWARRPRDRAADHDDPRRLAADLADMVREEGLGPRLHTLALPDSVLTCVLTELPSTNPDASDALVARRVRTELGHQSATILADHVLLDDPDPDSEAGGEAADARAFVAWGDQDALHAVLHQLEAEHVRVDRIVPVAAMLLEHFASARPDPVDGLEMFAHLSGHSAVLGVAVGRRLLYARFLADTLGDHEDGRDGGALEELERTIQFVRENQRGRRPQTLWLAGVDAERAVELGARVADELDLEVRHFRTPDPELPGDVLLLLLSVSPSLSRGAALLDVAPARSSRRVWWRAAACALLALAGVTGKLISDGAAEREAAALARIDTLADEIAEREAARPGLEARRAELARRERWQAAAAVAGLHREDAAAALLETLARVPPELRLVGAQFEGGDGVERPRTLRLTLEGDLTGAGADTLAGFCEQLSVAPWSAGVTVRAGDIELPMEDEAGTRALDERVSLRVALR